MKKTTFILAILIIAFFLLSTSFLNSQVGVEWNTFVGSTSSDFGRDIILDSSGNVYLTGYSVATWGSPINAHSGGDDAFVACMDSSGNLLWNTFMGSNLNDESNAIALDSAGNIYVTGYSDAKWGSPVNPHTGTYGNVFIACLDSSGNLLWNTFLGAEWQWVFGLNIVLDSSGSIYVTGHSDATWGSPINTHSGNIDCFVVCLNSSGNLIWNTFFGSASGDLGRSLTLDSSGNIYITGRSDATWGTPLNAHSGGYEAFVIKLNSSGNLIWNTFLGSGNIDDGKGISMDNAGNIYVTGESGATWGSPVNAHSGEDDAFCVCLSNSGNVIWNTFLGSYDDDSGYDLTLDSSGNIFVTGESRWTWGSPINAFIGGWDAFVACLDSSGNLLWNTFMGSYYNDHGFGIALDSSGSIHITGWSDTTWGLPLNAHSGGIDAFVAKITLFPVPDIRANGSDDPISITESDTLQIRVSLQRWCSSENVDYWLAYKGPSGWVHYNNTTKKWETGLGVTHQGPLMDLNNKKVFQSAGLALGVYTFYFGVDMVMDGKVTKSSLYKDEVKVTVTQ